MGGELTTPRLSKMISDKDRKAISSALWESAKSTFGRVKIGAVVTAKTGEITGYGHNQRRTHPRQYEANKRTGRQIENPCLHAEMAAILDTEDYEFAYALLKPHTIYVARLDRNGKWANCKPCPACRSEIERAGIKRVVFTTEQGIEEYKVNACG